jgi:hypothetical protein
MECSEVLIIANAAIEDSRRAVNALVKHLEALDDEIEAYEKIVENSDSAASYLGSQVKKSRNKSRNSQTHQKTKCKS